MKGVILAGGTGSRLLPLTKVTNKHLLPVYDWPMIYYPINTLIGLGVYDICVVLGGNSVGDVVNLLGDGSSFGVKLTYVHQEKPGGIAHALKLTEGFCGKDNFVVVLGDNILFKSPEVLQSRFPYVIATESDHPKDFGCLVFKDGDKYGGELLDIVEKPEHAPSCMIQTGVYCYRPDVWGFLETLNPSARGELEVTDLNKYYVEMDDMRVTSIPKGTWFDAGSIADLAASSAAVAEAKHTGEFEDYLTKGGIRV